MQNVNFGVQSVTYLHRTTSALTAKQKQKIKE